MSCDISDVAPIPPDLVENVVITFQQAIPQLDGSMVDATGQFNEVVVTLRYMWSPPEFQGEGISGYQAWLERMSASDDVTQNLHLIGSSATSDELQVTFNESNTNFTLYFQVRIASYSDIFHRH